MRVLSKCKEIVYQGRCRRCGSLIELSKEEYNDFERSPGVEWCPACDETLVFVPKSISKFYINEDGVYSRG